MRRSWAQLLLLPSWVLLKKTKNPSIDQNLGAGGGGRKSSKFWLDLFCGRVVLWGGGGDKNASVDFTP